MAKKAKNKKEALSETPSIGISQPHSSAAAGMQMPGANQANAAGTAAYNAQFSKTTATTVTTNTKSDKKNKKKQEANTKSQLDEFKRKNVGVDLTKLTPEQLAQLQLEEAIKESSNPAAGLAKLRNPLGVKGCLLNLLFFVILTIAVVILICYIQIDNFNLGIVLKDILMKYRIWQFFAKIFATIGGWFTPKSIIMIFTMGI